jgi:SWI/SNF-related matrix-associated actin-dependent regulator of chromatin subfamily A member 5
MLDRIRRKLFLSLKVMSTTSASSSSEGTRSEDNAQLRSAELMDILRKGSSAISRTDTGMDFGRFLNAPIEEILEESREKEGARDTRMKKDLKTEDGTGGADEVDIKAEEKEKLLQDAEEEERQLLSGVAQVQSRLFEGKVVARTQNNQEIADEWRELQKRARTDRLIVVGGIHVVADHMGYGEVSHLSKLSKLDLIPVLNACF